jgi:hypothetical protein
MNAKRVLWQLTLESGRKPTGKTQHFRDGQVLGPPDRLQIAQFPGDNGYYLLYLDETGREQSDTWHQFEADAMAQAKFEFEVEAAEWKREKC